jgi:hypothetical protein
MMMHGTVNVKKETLAVPLFAAVLGASLSQD